MMISSFRPTQSSYCPDRLATVGAVARGRQFNLRLASLVAVIGLSLCMAHGQSNLVPEATCVEYPTLPGSTNYIAHFSYVDHNSVDQTISAGHSNNYFAPAPVSGGPSNFTPGYHADAFKVPIPLTVQETWFAGSNYATATPRPGTQFVSGLITPSNPAPVPSPTCLPKFSPSPLAFTAPGTYTRQYLGQVDSGPPSDTSSPVIAVSAVLTGSSNISLANLTYVPSDPAYPNLLNPNSIYGDVTVTGGPMGSVSAALQVTQGGYVIMSGATTISFSGSAASSTGCPTNVTAGVTGHIGTAQQLFGTEIWTQLLTIKNTSGVAIPGPIVVALTGLSANATLFGSAGSATCPGIAGSPYIFVTGGLAPNANGAVVLTFTNSQVPTAAITYTPVVLSGGSRI